MKRFVRQQGFTPHLFPKSEGFTLIDMLVAAGIIAIVATFVLANFRQTNRNNLPFALQQVAGGLVEVQTLGFAGRLFSPTDLTYPAGGYGALFQDDSGQAVSRYTVFGDTAPIDGTGPTIANGSRTILSGNKIVGVYFTEAASPPAPFGFGWVAVPGSSASVVFNQGETAAYFAGEREPDPDATHLGLKLENQASGQAGYILVSLQTGLITSGLLP